jgi:hypothetical protein
MNLDEPEQGTFKLFSGEATGLAVRLTDWVYPLVCDVATGQARYDNFGGRWGSPKGTVIIELQRGGRVV